MTGIDDGGSGMLVERGQDVILVMEDEEEEDGDTGEPPALLPFSQLLFDDNNADDGRRTSPERFDDEPVDIVELVGDMIFGRMEEGNGF